MRDIYFFSSLLVGFSPLSYFYGWLDRVQISVGRSRTVFCQPLYRHPTLTEIWLTQEKILDWNKKVGMIHQIELSFDRNLIN